MLVQAIGRTDHLVLGFLALEIQEAVAKKEKLPRFGGIFHP